MKLLGYLLIAGVGLLSAQGFAATSPLVGTWILEKSENPMPDGSVVSYCTGVHGMIIYTDEGYVSVALNCAALGNGPEPADISDRKFFYSGTYQLNGKIASHQMLNASQPELIGESFTREVKIEGDLLILTGVNQGQTFSAYWRRVLQKKTDGSVTVDESHKCSPGTKLYFFWESPAKQTTSSCWVKEERAKRGFNCVSADNGLYPGNLVRGMCFGGIETSQRN